MKKLLLIAILSIATTIAHAQFVSGGNSYKSSSRTSSGLYSSGEGARMSGSVGLGIQVASQAAGPCLDWDLGCRIRDYVYAGLGFGLHTYMNFTSYSDYLVMTVPIYGNIKGFLPLQENLMPFISFSLGGQMAWLPLIYDDLMGGFYTNVAAGIEFGKHQISAGYELSVFHTGYFRYAFVF